MTPARRALAVRIYILSRQSPRDLAAWRRAWLIAHALESIARSKESIDEDSDKTED